MGFVVSSRVSLRPVSFCVCHGWLQDDGTFATTLDLAAHSRRTGASVTNAIVQELSDLIPNMTSLNLSGCDAVTDIGLWCVVTSFKQARGCAVLCGVVFCDVNFLKEALGVVGCRQEGRVLSWVITRMAYVHLVLRLLSVSGLGG